MIESIIKLVKTESWRLSPKLIASSSPKSKTNELAAGTFNSINVSQPSASCMIKS